MRTNRIAVTGMTCAACAARIERALTRMEGVEQASVNLALGQASIRFDPGKIEHADLKQRIEQLGYGVQEQKPSSMPEFEREVRAYRSRFLAAFLLSMPLFWGMLHHMTGGSFLWMPQLLASPYVLLALATLLQFGVGYPFYYGAYKALKQRTANMDVLIALSTTLAYLYSHYAVFHAARSHSGEHGGGEGHLPIYFDAVAMILTAVLLGKWLEAMAKGRALRDLHALYALQTDRVRVFRATGEQWIAADQVQAGDQVIIRAGEPVGADGIVIGGRAEVDEAMLSGESLPVRKTVHDRVYSGTRCLTGSLTVRATADTVSTRLSRMIAMVQEAQSGKPRLQRRIDRVAEWFVLLMLLCAGLTFAGWSILVPEAGPSTPLQNALAVLLVACPCALGLATPVSVLVASGLSARAGILFKSGSVLESLNGIRHIVLDKTGTLTEGRPTLETIHAEGSSGSRLLRFAAAVEQHSQHPAAQAIVTAALRAGLLVPQAEEVHEIAGHGIEGIVEGQRIRIGQLSWLAAAGIPLPRPDGEPAGSMVLHASIDNRYAGKILLSDRVRPDAPGVVKKLERAGEVWMLTGDHEGAAQAVAKASGLRRYAAGMTPEQKLGFIRDLQRKGGRVAMVGDGMNDAASLAAADVGIAMGGGTDAAMQAGDVVLLSNKLTGLLHALAISRITMRNVRQNIAFAILYNAAAVPLAALGYLDPRIACIGMAASSVLVVTNSLRLRRIGKRLPHE